MFVTAHNGSYSRQVFNGFQCLIWLLCDESRWMPERLRETLKKGFRDRVSWWLNEITGYSDAVLDTLYKRPKSMFSYTRTLRAELHSACVQALKTLGIDEDAGKALSCFIEGKFLEGYYEEEERFREARKRLK